MYFIPSFSRATFRSGSLHPTSETQSERDCGVFDQVAYRRGVSPETHDRGPEDALGSGLNTPRDMV